uniref:CSON010623 protein n=1 Tax=Culicoides sonorensis TaxID=179676 RepID=A0A336KJ78_CULSO
MISEMLSVHGGNPAEVCTNAQFWGCERQGTPSNILNPVRSARIRTSTSFNFKYGKAEVRAKLPVGDWLWPAIWFMPRYNKYGTWPTSGEIDLMESRGNKNLMHNGVNIGTEQVGQTLHFGPYWYLNGYDYASYVVNNGAGYDNDFHLYQLEWTPEYIKFSIDNKETTTIRGPFWELGKFDERAPNTDNPWRTAKSPLAPFDQEFFLIMNLAVGGTNGYFPDDAQNPTGKPWNNKSPIAFTEFWNNRGAWLPTWDLDTDYSKRASLKVDYVKIWAL